MKPTTLVVLLVLLSGCATTSLPRAAMPPQAIKQLDGSYYVVQRGDTLWRISRAFGLKIERVAAVNHLPNPSALQVGQRLFLPLPKATPQFLWPARGHHRSHESNGLEITLPAGSWVRASRGGRVAIATRRLAGWGQTIVLDHPDGYVSVYAGLDGMLANPGTLVPQGRPIGRTGHQALYFAIRHGTRAQDPLALLPN